MRKKLRNLLNIKEILPLALRPGGADPKSVVWALEEGWTEIVGAGLARTTRPLRVRGDELRIGVAHSALANELAFLQETLLARIRQAIPGSSIKRLRFQIVTFSSGGSGCRTSPEESLG